MLRWLVRKVQYEVKKDFLAVAGMSKVIQIRLKIELNDLRTPSLNPFHRLSMTQLPLFVHPRDSARSQWETH